MNEEPATTRGVPLWLVLLVAVAALVLATAAVTATVFARGSGFGSPMMGSYGNGSGYGGMMRGYGPTSTLPGPGEPGFVPGTASAPRVVRVFAGPGYAFTPSSIALQRGETVTFEVTTMGPLVHEFMVGPAADVAADTDGTPEVADIAMMQTKSVTYTFDGPGPYAFACHAAGHYEAGMRGAIVLVG